ncbi:MAG TPA: substrate-binding domain-containing protein [Clostridiales bacterium]|nr:substrate-binding domain-containing protein [Clostridiales bacterium]
MRKRNLKKCMAALLLGALLVPSLLGCSKTDTTVKTGVDSKTEESGKKEVIVAMLPKFKGENYFDACKIGAEEAADELGITLFYDGPSQDQATNQKQVDILEGWIAQKVNVIIVSPNDPTAIAPTLKKAQAAGIKVVTFDADAQEDARDLFVNQITAEAAAKGLLDAAARDLKEKGYGDSQKANIALVSSSGTDANQTAWQAAMNELLATDAYKFMVIKNEETDVYFPGTDETKVNSECATLISRMGEGEDKIQAAIGLSSMATPALGAQYQSASSKPNKDKVSLTGLATPNALKTYIKDEGNPLNTGVLWNCMDLGYLAVQSGYQLVTGDITSDSSSIEAGRLGKKEIHDKMCVLGDALVFDVTTVDGFDY